MPRTNQQMKRDLDAAGIEYPSDARHDDLAKLVADHEVPETADPFEPEGFDPNRGVNTTVPIYRDPMGEGSLGGAFVESGAVVNTGGPDPDDRVKEDKAALKAHAEHRTHIVAQHEAQGNDVEPNDGVPRGNISEMQSQKRLPTNPVGSGDGVPRGNEPLDTDDADGDG